MICYHSIDVTPALFSAPWLVKIFPRGFEIYELANDFQVLNVQNSALLKLPVRTILAVAL
jgi:hypothetical protein